MKLSLPLTLTKAKNILWTQNGTGNLSGFNNQPNKSNIQDSIHSFSGIQIKNSGGLVIKSHKAPELW